LFKDLLQYTQTRSIDECLFQGMQVASGPIVKETNVKEIQLLERCIVSHSNEVIFTTNNDTFIKILLESDAHSTNSSDTPPRWNMFQTSETWYSRDNLLHSSRQPPTSTTHDL